MVDLIPRTEWQDPRLPVVGPPIIKSKVAFIPAHYTAAIKIPDGDAAPDGAVKEAVARFLRDIQRDYMNKTPLPYSIGYNFAIDQTGQGWEARGWDIKCAANKEHLGRKWNEETLAILCMVDANQPMNSKMVATFRALGAEAEERFGRKMTVVGHRDIGATLCPGTGIYAQVTGGLLTPFKPAPIPTPPPQPPLPGDDTMTIRIFESFTTPKEFHAMFFAECDAQNRSIELQWSGDGNDPRVQERIATMQANFGPSLPLLLDGVKNNRLHPKHKPSDIADSAKVGGWTDADFAP